MKYEILTIIMLLVVVVMSGCINHANNKATNQTYKVNVTQSDGSWFWIYYVLFMNNNGGYSYAIQDSKSPTGYVTMTDSEVATIQKSGGTITGEEYSSFIAPGEDVVVPSNEVDEATAEVPSELSSDSSASDSSNPDSGTVADSGD
jgi:hypothetical protein